VALEGRRVLEPGGLAVGVGETAAAHHHVPAPRRVELERRALERARQQQVVGVQEAQQLAGGQLEAAVEGRALAAVGLALEARQPGRVAARDLGGVVGAASSTSTYSSAG